MDKVICRRMRRLSTQETLGVLSPAKARDPSIDSWTLVVPLTGLSSSQKWNCRLCVTDDPANRMQFEKPDGYRDIDHELLIRVLESGDIRLPILIHKLPNRKFDWNSMHAVGTDLPGLSWTYPEADHKQRTRIAAEHALYAKGVMWTLAYHPRAPESIRRFVSRHG